MRCIGLRVSHSAQCTDRVTAGSASDEHAPLIDSIFGIGLAGEALLAVRATSTEAIWTFGVAQHAQAGAARCIPVVRVTVRRTLAR